MIPSDYTVWGEPDDDDPGTRLLDRLFGQRHPHAVTCCICDGSELTGARTLLVTSERGDRSAYAKVCRVCWVSLSAEEIRKKADAWGRKELG